jgi:uncharacterized BrkB/YihY/UPF0761 family membrane protein
MNGTQFLIGFISVFLALVLGIMLFFILFTVLTILNKCFYPHPEHVTMPVSEMFCAIVLTIPLSIIILVKLYTWLKKNQNID